MRQIYSSPISANVDRLVALLEERGIEATVQNRSRWNRPGYKRHSYAQPEARESWPQVWVTHADDYTRARELLRELGIEPAVRHAELLAAMRAPKPKARTQDVVRRARRIVLAAVVGAFLLLMLRYLHVL